MEKTNEGYIPAKFDTDGREGEEQHGIIVMLNPECPAGGEHSMDNPNDPTASCCKCGMGYGVDQTIKVFFGMDNSETGFDINAPTANTIPDACPVNPKGHQPVGITWEEIIETRSTPKDTRCVCGALLIAIP